MKNILALVLALLLIVSCSGGDDIDLRETDIATLQGAMQRGEMTSQDIVAYYLSEIARIDRAGPNLRSIIEINPDALEIAAALDQERAESGPRGPLHGIPVVLKANIDTGDQMHTTAGSLALANHRARDDAFMVARLRDAGAVILGKSNLSEWANFRSDYSSSGWSSIGGQTKNPYDPTRNPCGSSSGSAVAVSANLTSLAIGTETDGSVVCPSGINGIVGIKPTLGLVSRDGIIPIAHSQDTAGPMARTVTDAAILLNAMSIKDENDSASAARPEQIPDYAAGLSPDALQGKRIGVLRTHYGAGENPKVEAVLTAAIELLTAQKAIIIDPIEFDTEGMSEAEGTVLDYEFKTDLNAYLQDGDAEIKSLEDIIQFNIDNAETVMPIFLQERMDASQESGSLADYKYLLALKESKRISQAAIDDAMESNNLDAIIATTNSPAWLTDHINGDTYTISSSSFAAVSGYASITVPAGQVNGLPIGVSFIGGAFSERQLIEIAYAFEQSSNARKPPPLN
jgi:amidase